MRDYSLSDLARLLPYPAQDAHKYSRGRLVVVGGSKAYPGAAALAALAAQRAGAGYTQAFVDASVRPLVQGFAPSLVVRAWEGLDGANIVADPGRPCAAVVGCGFDPLDGAIAGMTQSVLAEAEAPVLLDGGAFSALSSSVMWGLLAQREDSGFPTVVTPHGGEAAALAKACGVSAGEPAELAGELARSCHAVCVLKGPDTYISDGVGCHVVSEGTAALSKAGTGDVLAGIVGALLAQGIDPVDACVLGVTLHARAGSLAADELTPIAVTAEDVVGHLPHAIRSFGVSQGAGE